jgi:hypothetical protein
MRNLPFARQHRVMFHAASVREDWSVRVRAVWGPRGHDPHAAGRRPWLLGPHCLCCPGLAYCGDGPVDGGDGASLGTPGTWCPLAAMHCW